MAKKITIDEIEFRSLLAHIINLSKGWMYNENSYINCGTWFMYENELMKRVHNYKVQLGDLDEHTTGPLKQIKLEFDEDKI